MASSGVQALTHTQRVTRLYRRSLKHLLSWYIDRSVWRQEALKLRDRFDEAKNVSMPIAKQLLRDGEYEFRMHRHPEPYTLPTAPGGSKWERNIPPPEEALEMTPEEEEWEREWMQWNTKK